MAKHTPGPWVVEGTLIAQESGINDSLEVAFLAELGGGMDKRMREANARLIAAAPDLYDAAENALEALIGCCVPAGGVDDRKTMLEAQRMLRAAIVKATGDA